MRVAVLFFVTEQRQRVPHNGANIELDRGEGREQSLLQLWGLRLDEKVRLLEERLVEERVGLIERGLCRSVEEVGCLLRELVDGEEVSREELRSPGLVEQAKGALSEQTDKVRDSLWREDSKQGDALVEEEAIELSVELGDLVRVKQR
jgi:hypothetical protein